MSLRAWFKGLAGEWLGSMAHRVHLDRRVYVALDNITLQTPNGTTQIDHVIVSRHGIFVVEAKNIDGWIFGDERSPQWAIVKPGRKHRMQNPLHQNYRHVMALVEFLQIDAAKVHSVVMFWGECEFKTALPANVMKQGYATYIKGFADVVFSDADVQQIVTAITTGALPKSRATWRAHLASLEERHASTSQCPKCGSALGLRSVRQGAKAGTQFYGCSAYPKCRHTAPYGGGR